MVEPVVSPGRFGLLVVVLLAPAFGLLVVVLLAPALGLLAPVSVGQSVRDEDKTRVCAAYAWRSQFFPLGTGICSTSQRAPPLSLQVAIIGRHQVTTDIPEHAYMKLAIGGEGRGGRYFWGRFIAAIRVEADGSVCPFRACMHKCMHAWRVPCCHAG